MDHNTFSTGKKGVRNAGTVVFRKSIYGSRVPLCRCLCFGAGGCPSRKHFQTGQGPSTKHQQILQLRFCESKKLQGTFFQKRILSRVWDRIPQNKSGGQVLERIGIDRHEKKEYNPDGNPRKRGKTRWQKRLLPTVCVQGACLKW